MEKRQQLFKAALFDLDGVLLDTETQYTQFWGNTARTYRPDVSGLEFLIKGQTLPQIFDRFFDRDDWRKEIKDKLDVFEMNMNYTFIPGVRDFIDELKSYGVKMAVVTSSNQVKMSQVYRKVNNFMSLFDAILTSEDFDESKPSPDCYLKAAQRLGVEVENSVVFEDSFNGLKAGGAANMMVVALATTNKADDIAPLAHLVVSDFTSLHFTLINEMMKQ